MPPLPHFAINPSLDVVTLASRYARDGRVQVVDLFAPECVRALHDTLQARDDWVQVINSTDRIFEVPRTVQAEMPDEKRRALDTAVYAGARTGFQFRYETIRVPDEDAARAASDDPLAEFARFLSTGEMRDLLRRVTRDDTIDFADAQATAFAPGDFLTAHDDEVAGKCRRAAYVFGLTPQWRPEWGGLLLFHDDREVIGGYVPGFNTLNLFRVPQRHSVSEVTRAAPCPRYSVTGWLRSRS